MPKSTRLLIIFLLVQLSHISYAQHILEDFENNDSYYNWSTLSATELSWEITPSAAHSGSFGMTNSLGWVHKNQIRGIGNPGDKISMWGKLDGNGEIHLGFSALGYCCRPLAEYSIVMAGATNEFIFQYRPRDTPINIAITGFVW